MNQLLPATINLAKLARDLAQDMFEPAEIRDAHKLSDEQFAKILQDDTFQRMLRDVSIEWNSAASTPERIRVKAQSAVEVALDQFFVDICDRGIPLVQRTDALKALMKLGELGEKDAPTGAVGTGVQITINLGTPGEGQEAKTITLDADPVTENPALLPG